jgi:PAS domain S-box-containing protein
MTRLRYDGWRLILLVAGFKVVLLTTLFAESQATNATFLPPKTAPAFTIRSWTTASGLPHNDVRQIAQTADGYLWIATANGLVRSDGDRFKIFGRADGLTSTDIEWLFVDSSDQLWLGSHQGSLQRLAQGRITTFPLQPEHSSITEDRAHRIWVTAGQGLFRQSAGGWERLQGREGVPDKPIIRVLADRKGGVWIAPTTGGLYCWREGRCSVVTNNYLPYVWALAEDDLGHIWAGSADGQAIEIVEGQIRKHLLATNESLSLNLYSFAAAGDGSIWAATYGGQLFRFDGKVWAIASGLGDLTNQEPRYLFRDRGNSLWLGSRVGGLHRLTPKRSDWFGAPNGLAHEFTRSVTEAADGSLYVATEKGAVYRGVVDRFAPLPEAGATEAPSDARCVFRAADGQLWFGFYPGVIQRMRDGRLLPRFSADALAVGNWVTAFCDDGEGGVLAAWGGAGVWRITPNGDDQLVSKVELERHVTMTMLSEPGGRLWLGGPGELLCLQKGKVIERFTATNGLPRGGMFALHRDASGVLWIGTEAGLGRLQDGQLKVITREHGLVDDAICQILEDDSECLWLGSNHGIMRVARSDAKEVATGLRSWLHCLQLGHDEGMLSETCTSGSSPSARRLRDGRLCFPTTRGLVVVDPRQFPSTIADPRQPGLRAAPPTVLIEEAIIDGRPSTTSATAPPQVLTIPPGNHRVEIHYTGLTPSAPDKVRFRYRLESFDQDWTRVGTRRVAYFQGLPPGNYLFHVAAVSNDGAWNEAGATLPLVVQPFLWQTNWFRLLAVLGLIGGSSLTVWRVTRTKLQRRIERLEQQRELEAERARLASVLEGTSDFVAFADRKGYVLYVNPAGRRMLGMGDTEDISGSRTASYHPRWATELIQSEGLPSATRDGIWSGETALLHRDGREIPVSQVMVAHKDATGALNFLSTIARDITERKRIQADLERRVEERTAELTATNKELEAFAFTVSHDLRAPLRNMAGFIQLLRERSKLVLDEVSIRYGKIVENEAQRLSALIDELLAFCRLGRTELRRSEVSLDQLIAEIRSELQTEAKDRKIIWRIDPLPVVQADRTLLRQVLVNLISNAIKYTRKKDEAQIQIGGHTTDLESKEWVFYVRDNGAGFDMKYAAKLFGVFQRLHSASEFEGTGVGLANVQRIIERHGGHVWAEAEESKGATFYFTLPK